MSKNDGYGRGIFLVRLRIGDLKIVDSCQKSGILQLLPYKDLEQ